MFSATMVLMSEDILSGAIMMGMIVFFAVSYILLSRNGSRYPTDLCVVGCILCCIAIDVIWGFFNFGSHPLLTITGEPGSATKLFYEFMIAGVICFDGLIITNIIKNKKFRKIKIALFLVFGLVAAHLLVNIVQTDTVAVTLVYPGTTALTTDVILVCVACLLIIALGAIAVVSREKRSAVNTAMALILALLTVAAGAAGIYKLSKDHRAGYIVRQNQTNTVGAAFYDGNV